VSLKRYLIYENAQEEILQSKGCMELEGLYLMNTVGYGQRDPGFDYRQRQFFLSSKPPRPAISPAQSPVHSLRMFFVKRSGRTHLHLVPRIRMSGATLLFPLDTFMSWTKTNNKILGYHRSVVEAFALLGSYLT
jgi:hypothetical protein